MSVGRGGGADGKPAAGFRIVSRRVESVAIVGRDAAAWIAAIALQRAVGRTGVRVQVVRLPSHLQEVDLYSAAPSLVGLHKLMGLDEALVLRAGSGVPMAGQRFSNWGRSKPPFIHGYDNQDPGGYDLGFLQYWLKARAEGLRVEYEDFSLAAAAAKHGRFPSGAAQNNGLSAARGYNLHAIGYVALLKQYAQHLGVEIKAGPISAIDRDGDTIASVTLADGERVEADLFIDASGEEALLIRDMPGSDFEPWSEWLPCDRILAASGPRLNPLPAYSQISAFRGGWVGLYPLQNRTAVVAVYDSSNFSDADMQQSLPVLSGMQIGGDAVITPFRSGMRPRPWIGNCVAVGEAAIALEPLDAVQLHLAHIGVSHLVTLFPVDADQLLEAEPYNSAMVANARNVRDFQIAHYRLNQRYDEPFWDRARDVQGPESLETKTGLFGSRGQIILYDDESFQEQNWSSIFIGHGLMPRSYDPRIDLIPREEHIQKVQQRLREIAVTVNSMPSVETYVAGFERKQGFQ